jgi:hypothetical protein
MKSKNTISFTPLHTSLVVVAEDLTVLTKTLADDLAAGLGV